MLSKKTRVPEPLRYDEPRQWSPPGAFKHAAASTVVTPTSHIARSRAIRCAGSSTTRRPSAAMAWRKGQECAQYDVRAD
eukprot:3221941-Prymnesium_polylepis.1